MARSDLLLKLVEAATKGDRTLLRRTLEALIAEERRKQHHVLADELADFLRENGTGRAGTMEFGTEIARLLHEAAPRRGLSDLILPDVVREAVDALLEEQFRREVLRSYGLEPRHRLLLAGPPGNGKTSLAEAIANELRVSLLTVRYEGVIGSFLGETSTRLRKVFEYASTRDCVLFFDEFDAVGKERGDVHETGEIKRVVNSLLLQIDNLPSHVVVIAATNHPELLDRAVWRRFELRLELPAPSRRIATAWLEHLQRQRGIQLGLAPRTLADKLPALSMSQLEEFAISVLRRQVLNQETPPEVHARRELELWRSSYQPNHSGE